MIGLIPSTSLCLRSFLRTPYLPPSGCVARGRRLRLSEPRGFSLYYGANHCNFAGGDKDSVMQ